MRNQVMPAGRSLWIVTMKLMPVRIELKPTTNAPNTRQVTARGRLRAVGRVERPARVDRAEGDRGQREQGPDHVEVVAPEIQPRKGDVLGAEHQRQDEVAQRPGRAGDQHQEDHHHAVKREELVVGLVDGDVLERPRTPPGRSPALSRSRRGQRRPAGESAPLPA